MIDFTISHLSRVFFYWKFLVYFISAEKWNKKREIPWGSSNIYFFLEYRFVWCQRFHPMDTSSSIPHRLNAETLRGKFVKISSILKGESTWKLWHRFEVEISTWIRFSKPTKYRWVFHVNFSMPFRSWIDVSTLLTVSFLSFSYIFCCGSLF